jgi:hypothetical protein
LLGPSPVLTVHNQFKPVLTSLISFNRFPPKDRYKFSEPDAVDNIVFEDPDKSNGIPLIKVNKQVQSQYVRTFNIQIPDTGQFSRSQVQ